MVDLLLPIPDCDEPTPRANAQGLARVAVDDGAATLVVTFLGALTAAQQIYACAARSYSLTGGQRIFPRIRTATLYNPPGTPPDLQDRRVLLALSEDGDFSIYTLTVSGPDVDPFFASHKLRFRLACDDPFDCQPPLPAAPLAPELPVVIDYLAKDYSSFRQALLDFVPTRLPAWTERSEADIGMMLLELFAATADTLSYMQDRVANEAFLGTASQRRSVAGHLALIGYAMDEGAVAHTWLQFQVNGIATWPAAPGLRVSTRARLADEPVVVFETLGPFTLRSAHNEMPVYNWGHNGCCLRQDALGAALVGVFPDLQAGDYLLFDDGRGQRDVVRLTGRPAIIPADPIKARPDGPLTIVQWSPVTPLHADYCTDTVVARGNLVPATHGETILKEPVRALTAEQQAALDAEIATRPPWARKPRQRLRLAHAPLAHLDPTTVALATPLPLSPPTPVPPSILARAPGSVSTLQVEVEGFAKPWQEQRSLLDSRPDAQVFRVEIDDDGDATVVFGDDTFGLAPPETARVTATYRAGGGAAGNLGADTLTLPRQREGEAVPWLVSVTNPLPAVGGRDLESRDHARRFGPPTFQKPLVAVTAADYEAAAVEFVDALGGRPIARAKATFRWTGSWLTVTLAVDPRGAESLDPALRRALLAYLDTRRLAGYDLEVIRALYVSVELAVEICLAPGFRSGDVQHGVQQALSTADLAGGRKGFFHPDNFSFGDNLYISRLYASIEAVPGVASAQITRLARLWSARAEADTAVNVAQGFLAVGADEIVRLDNDRNFPERGVLTVRTKGVGA